MDTLTPPLRGIFRPYGGGLRVKARTGRAKLTRTTLRALVVDDEVDARRELANALQASRWIEVAGQATSVAEAITVVEQQPIDLVILDVNLPMLRGFDLLPHLPPETQVIVVTASKTDAFKAFEFNVVDYVLKPLRRDRLHLALERVRQRRRASVAAVDLVSRPRDREIILQSSGDMHVVTVPSITFIKAVGNYTQVNLGGGRMVLVRKSMEAWQSLLPADSFCRPHRSLIVNLHHVKSVVKLSRDHAELQFRTLVTPIQVGRRATALVQRALRRGV